MLSTAFFQWLAGFFAFIAMMALPPVIMEGEAEFKRICIAMQCCWILSGICVVISFYREKQLGERKIGPVTVV